MLNFFHGMILLAGVGAVTLVKLSSRVSVRAIVILLLITASAHLAWQGGRAAYKYHADPCNPYVYAHTTTDIFSMVKRIEDIADVCEDGRDIQIHVICPDADYWPLPWYLRAFSKVGYWDHVTDDVTAAAVIIASPEFEQPLLTKLYQLPPPGQKKLYVPLFDSYLQLRPHLELRGYVTNDLWDKFKQSDR